MQRSLSLLVLKSCAPNLHESRSLSGLISKLTRYENDATKLLLLAPSPDRLSPTNGGRTVSFPSVPELRDWQT